MSANIRSMLTSVVLAEIQAGHGLSLSAAGRTFPAHRGQGTVAPSTVLRWLLKGARAQNGQRVKLEAVRLGSRWLTSRPALARFVAALSECGVATVPDPARTVVSTSKARSAAAARAERELQKRGA